MEPVNLYCTVRALPARPRDPHGARDRGDPELVEHLRGFEGYAMHAAGQPTAQLFGVIQCIKHVRHHLVVTDWDEAWADFADAAMALTFFPDGSIRDARGRQIFGPEPDPTAQAPIADDARERMAHAVAQLAEIGIDVPAHLTPGLGRRQATVRTPETLLDRAITLTAMAARAKTYQAGDPIPADLLTAHGPLSPSPRERAVLEATEPKKKGLRGLFAKAPEEIPPELLNGLGWRIEAAAWLLWALGLYELAPGFDAQVDPGALAALLSDGRDALLTRAEPRSLDALLDEQARVRGAAWAVRQAVQVDGTAPPAGMDPGVVVERHTAANWATHQWGETWDEVDIPS